MKIATWNVNSVRAREERLLAWLERHQPDVLCLQELKVQADAFPTLALRGLGYEAAVFGQRTYNGVAVVSRIGLEGVHTGFLAGDDDGQARLVAATVQGLRVISAYVPNGAQVGSDKWAYKLAWLERLAGYVAEEVQRFPHLVLAGDFNIAPDDTDVRHPERWASTVLCHPEGRAALARVQQRGLVDLVRQHHPAGGLYSWWDYRMLGFPKNDGLRIDHLWGTSPVAQVCTAAGVDREERKGKLASDHAPVWAELAR